MWLLSFVCLRNLALFWVQLFCPGLTSLLSQVLIPFSLWNRKISVLADNLGVRDKTRKEYRTQRVHSHDPCFYHSWTNIGLTNINQVNISKVKPVEVLCKMLSWKSSSFHISSEPAPDPPSDKKSKDSSLTSSSATSTSINNFNQGESNDVDEENDTKVFSLVWKLYLITFLIYSCSHSISIPHYYSAERAHTLITNLIGSEQYYTNTNRISDSVEDFINLNIFIIQRVVVFNISQIFRYHSFINRLSKPRRAVLHILV